MKGDEKRRAGERKSRKSQKTARNNLRGTFIVCMHKKKEVKEHRNSLHQSTNVNMHSVSQRSKMDRNSVTTSVKRSPFHKKNFVGGVKNRMASVNVGTLLMVRWNQ